MIAIHSSPLRSREVFKAEGLRIITTLPQTRAMIETCGFAGKGVPSRIC
jgi:hypothetical protein